MDKSGKNEEIECKMGVVKNCTGSSSFTYHGTTVICVIQGPFNSHHRDEKSDRADLIIRWKESKLIHDRISEKYYSAILKDILSKFIILELDPHKTIEISVHIMVGERNALLCAVNSCLAALLDAGIPLSCLFYATSTSKFDEEVVVFAKQDGMFIREYSHCFGEITDNMKKIAMEKLPYIEDIILFALNSKQGVDD
ncbi:Exosome complex component Rrp41 [Astathelohania contejeani]|uniref:Exosome complex component Rrp41 n=1 Tax=Astathelohania contejeani TaxID=164912 RepID=A0ABQ7HYG7_9MICR|nr:Exosome complex component Rrp41 [Thelohania contejeani]